MITSLPEHKEEKGTSCKYSVEWMVWLDESGFKVEDNYLFPIQSTLVSSNECNEVPLLTQTTNFPLNKSFLILNVINLTFFFYFFFLKQRFLKVLKGTDKCCSPADRGPNQKMPQCVVLEGNDKTYFGVLFEGLVSQKQR